MGVLEIVAAAAARRASAVSIIVAVVGLSAALDLLLPLGAVEGLGYLLIVPAFGLLPDRWAYFAGAVLASFGVIGGYLLSPLSWGPDQGLLAGYLQAAASWSIPREVALLNRSIALLAIWGLALSMFGRRVWKDHSDRLDREVAEERSIAARERLLAQEMDHRLKNMLSQVAGIVHSTKATATSREAAGVCDLILARIQALAAACGILAAERWEDASIRSLVAAELALHGEDRFDLPAAARDVRLTARAAAMTALVLHELATNATKYGALSTRGGHVQLDWYVSRKDARFVIEWKELNGPPVLPPRRTGFGTRLIERAVGYELGARSTLEYRPEGVRCRIELPLEYVVDEQQRTARAPAELRAS